MSLQIEIKNNLLNGSITKSDFLRKLLDLDQSTLDRENCFENIEVMESPQIKKIFETSDLETKYNYYRNLRFFYFHAFQNEASTFESLNKAIKHLVMANQLSDTLEKILPNEDPLFSKYILGTLYYIKNDLNNLTLLIEDYEKGDKNDLIYSNIDRLKKLQNNLNLYKSVDYSRDYLN